MNSKSFSEIYLRHRNKRESELCLESGSRVAVIGGGPAGAFFSYFLLELAERVGIELHVDIYEPRDFSLPAPQGCNMCGGVISETLVQNLATEGIILPPSVIQTAINSYILHTDVGDQKILPEVPEKRIAALFRATGPRGYHEINREGFDHFLISLAERRGANVIRARVTGVEKGEDCLTVRTGKSAEERYSFLVVAAGVNSTALKLFDNQQWPYRAPKTTKTVIKEYFLGKDIVSKTFGDSLHVFLLDIPKLDFAMIVPKGDYISLCLLGKDIDEDLIKAFSTAPEVTRSLPEGWRWDMPDCHCMPRINVQAANHPCSDRIVFVGDISVTRLYKDGIGAAYRASKAAATCAVLQGISSEDFKRFYEPFCRRIEIDNLYGRILFSISYIFQHFRVSRKAMLRIVAFEQQSPSPTKTMSSILWDTFTGSSLYKEVFFRTLRPTFIRIFIWTLAKSIFDS